jgi:hypothetical protein
MASLSELTPTIRTTLGQVPPFVVDNELKNVAQTFLQETEVWGEALEVDFMSGDQEIMWMPPRGTMVYRTLWLMMEGKKLEPVSLARFHELSVEDRPGKPRYFTQDMNGKVLVYPIPDKNYTGTLNAIYTLKGGNDIPDQIMNQYKPALIDGALATLFMMDGAWGNASRGQYFWERYQMGVDRAKRRAFRDASNRLRVTSYGGL